MMEHLLQCDNRWRDNKLGTCSDTICQSGCFCTALAMLCGKNPDEVNDLLREKGGYIDGCLVQAPMAAIILNLEYYGKSSDKPDYDTIAETTYFAPKVPQHFIVVKKDGSILDPLGKNINYPIKSYRLFKTNEGETMPWSDNEVRAMFEAVRHDLLGQNPTDNDLNADMGAAKERQKEPEDWALSEFVHDRFKEMKPKDCTTEVATAVACCTEKCDATKKEMEDEMTKELEEHNVFAKQAAAEMKKRDDLIAKMKNPAISADCPQVPDKNCNWWCKLWGCCK